MPNGPAASDISRLGPSRAGFEFSLANEQSVHAVDDQRLLSAARRVLADSKFTSATISVAVVDDRQNPRPQSASSSSTIGRPTS